MDKGEAVRLATAAARAGMEHSDTWIEDEDSTIYGIWRRLADGPTGLAFEERELHISTDQEWPALYIMNMETTDETMLTSTGEILLMLKSWEQDRDR